MESKFKGTYSFRKTIAVMMFLVIAVTVLPLQVMAAGSDPDYSDRSNWAYYAMSEETLAGEDLSSSLTKQADCFLVCPTVYMGDADHLNMSLQDEKTKEGF